MTRSLKLLASSAFILGILGLQSATILTKLADRPMGGKYWPIIDYPMYSRPRYENEVLPIRAIVQVVDARDVVREVQHAELKLGVPEMDVLANRLRHGVPQAIAGFLRDYPTDTPIVKIRVLSYPLKITRHGPAPAQSELLNEIDVRVLVGRGSAT